MNSYFIFLIFLGLVFGGLAAATANTDLIVGVTKDLSVRDPLNGRNLNKNSPGFSELLILDLPADFDLSNPALDIQSQLAMLEADPSASLPQLPDSIKALAKRLPAHEASSDGATIIHCDFGGKQPDWIDGINLGNKLKGLGGSWCCQVKANVAPPCTAMLSSGSAATAICSPPKRCVPCNYVGHTILNHVLACKKGNTAGGFSRWVLSLSP
jgi:hypothetical protein